MNLKQIKDSTLAELARAVTETLNPADPTSAILDYLSDVLSVKGPVAADVLTTLDENGNLDDNGNLI